MIHELKIWKEYFDKIITGEKTFEVRLNERGFTVGDYLALNEIEKDEAFHGRNTGRSCIVKVTDVFDSPGFVIDGYVILSIQPCRIETHKRLPAEVYETEDGE